MAEKSRALRGATTTVATSIEGEHAVPSRHGNDFEWQVARQDWLPGTICQLPFIGFPTRDRSWLERLGRSVAPKPIPITHRTHQDATNGGGAIKVRTNAATALTSLEMPALANPYCLAGDRIAGSPEGECHPCPVCVAK